MTNTKLLDHLRRVEIFTGLLDEELLKVAELCSAVRVPAGKAVFKEGDGGDELYIIHEGSVRVLINTRCQPADRLCGDPQLGAGPRLQAALVEPTAARQYSLAAGRAWQKPRHLTYALRVQS